MSATLQYISLGDAKYDTVSSMIRKSYPNACILWMEEVHNETLCKRYETYKRNLVEQHGDESVVNELLLFHGTKEQNIVSIANHGFDNTRNVTSAYGKGTYFARDAQYSTFYSHARKDDDISFMMLCKVVCAKPCLGRHNMNIDTRTYDYAVNSLQSPSIYVIPHDDAAIPVYVVAFYKNAM